MNWSHQNGINCSFERTCPAQRRNPLESGIKKLVPLMSFMYPEKNGLYEIRVFCGNIPLNGGHTFRKEARLFYRSLEL
ncbi:Hypothetical predicted protein [Olea europaea subsp. europaea]|uniref:Uncharacterized protein n=1 Tax=Olea europaea subsp. europaea TaxID=158383 RepID=A0A8S0PQS2_OLEEU|nr:Hypothetical predicted protein [Olea europaea subsp. europaea]